MRGSATIEKFVKRLLDEQGVVKPWVDVSAVAKRLDATVRYEEFEDDVAGALYQKDGAIVIGVNRSHHSHRQRFSIAHEIGHLQLGHKEELFVDHHYVGIPSHDAASATIRRLHRDTISSQAIDPQEIEANRFAAALLMPRHFLDRSLASHRGPIDEKGVELLAKTYKVSVQAMLFRLMNLGAPVDPA